MKLAKPRFDVAVFTAELEPMLAFWQQKVGLPFEEMLPVGSGTRQHRHGLAGSVFKLNHARELPAEPRSGYRELLIAREGVARPVALSDPDGSRVTLVPPDYEGIERIAVRVAVRDPEAHADFYARVLQLEDRGGHRFACGDSQLWLERDPAATPKAALRGPGYRYLTIQVFDCPEEHAGVLARGGREGLAPVRAGDVAVFSMVRDPDGNFVELSQRKSLTGSLEPGS